MDSYYGSASLPGEFAILDYEQQKEYKNQAQNYSLRRLAVVRRVDVNNMLRLLRDSKFASDFYDSSVSVDVYDKVHANGSHIDTLDRYYTPDLIHTLYAEMMKSEGYAAAIDNLTDDIVSEAASQSSAIQVESDQMNTTEYDNPKLNTSVVLPDGQQGTIINAQQNIDGLRYAVVTADGDTVEVGANEVQSVASSNLYAGDKVETPDGLGVVHQYFPDGNDMNLGDPSAPGVDVLLDEPVDQLDGYNKLTHYLASEVKKLSSKEAIDAVDVMKDYLDVGDSVRVEGTGEVGVVSEVLQPDTNDGSKRYWISFEGVNYNSDIYHENQLVKIDTGMYSDVTTETEFSGPPLPFN